ncbi:MAG: C1 family peptidase [Pseudomonadota bacterium]|nr:C1 family peptidase [Pseudomonadota bacterium]
MKPHSNYFLQRLWRLMLTMVFISIASQAATPPGLPLMDELHDPFAIPNVLPQKRKIPLKKWPTTLVYQATAREDFTIPITEIQTLYGLSLSAEVLLSNQTTSSVKVILIDEQQHKEFLVYETYPALTSQNRFTVEEVCEGTCIIPEVNPFSLRIELIDAAITVYELTYLDTPPPLMAQELNVAQQSLKHNQNTAKIQKLNEAQLGWIAGETSVSQLSYEAKKKLFLEPQVPHLQGFEFYQGGIFTLQATDSTAATEGSALVEQFTWGNRHGDNWITPVKNQLSCGACWAFTATAMLETVSNLYFNQHLDLDLSEQELVSCSAGGDCQGGIPGPALDYFADSGIVTEACFSYSATNQACHQKCLESEDWLQTRGRVSWGSMDYPKSEDTLKKMLIEYGPLSSGIVSLRHGMQLIGFETDLQDQRTIWIFKNSWGKNWGGQLTQHWGDYYAEGYGDNGYAYIKLNLNNLGWVHGIRTPVRSAKPYEIQCVDQDNDQFCQWGLSPEKPDSCPEQCRPEPDCNDADPNLGPFDASYRCQVIGIPKKNQYFTVYNEGNQDLVITSIAPETATPWLSVIPTHFKVAPGTAQQVIVQVDYALMPSVDEALNQRLLVNSNDIKQTPYPQGIDIIIEQPNLYTAQPLPEIDIPVTDDAPLPLQDEADLDADGIGNAVDLDDDNDGLPDDYERRQPHLEPDLSDDALVDHDNNGCTALEEYRGNGLPCLGQAYSVDIQGDSLTTATVFLGGIALNEQPFQAQIQLNLADKVDIQGMLLVAPEHVGQRADLVVYAGYQLPSGEQVFYMLDERINIFPWNEEISQLVTFKEVVLEAIQPITLYQGHFLLPGQLAVFFGYRLENGTVVTNQNAIEIDIH